MKPEQTPLSAYAVNAGFHFKKILSPKKKKYQEKSQHVIIVEVFVWILVDRGI